MPPKTRYDKPPQPIQTIFDSAVDITDVVTGEFNDSRSELAPVQYKITVTGEFDTMYTETITVPWGCFLNSDDPLTHIGNHNVTADGPIKRKYKLTATSTAGEIVREIDVEADRGVPSGTLAASTLYPARAEVFTISWTATNGRAYVYDKFGSLMFMDPTASSGSFTDQVMRDQTATYRLKVINQALESHVPWRQFETTLTVWGDLYIPAGEGEGEGEEPLEGDVT